jgi:hypothetical protein
MRKISTSSRGREEQMDVKVIVSRNGTTGTNRGLPPIFASQRYFSIGMAANGIK